MHAQANLYNSNVFLNEALSRVVAELVSPRVECFRSLETYLGFFVPTYSTLRGGINSEQVMGLRDWLKIEIPNNTKAQFAVNHFFTGGVSAVAEYSVFQAADGFDSEVLILRKKVQSAL
jgi:hypothetical protein